MLAKIRLCPPPWGWVGYFLFVIDQLNKITGNHKYLARIDFMEVVKQFVNYFSY